MAHRSYPIIHFVANLLLFLAFFITTCSLLLQTSRMTVCAILQRRKIVETNVSTMKNATLTMNCA